MAPILYPLSRIATGWNNTAGYTAWENLAPANTPKFYPPAIWGRLNPGIIKVRGDGLTGRYGFKSTPLTWSGRLTARQWYYLFNTINGGNYSGKVTVSVPTENPDGYANYNAILFLPPLSESQRNFKNLTSYEAFLRRLVAI